MKTQLFAQNGEVSGEIELGKAFSKPIRSDIIKRAVLAEQSKMRTSYGADPMAGKRTSATYRGRRGRRWSMMNKEMARMKRIVNSGYLNYAARFVPQAKKGRKAHPPKVEKIWTQKINKKERIAALLSAVSATTHKDLVVSRGHKADDFKTVPIVFADAIQEMKKNKDVVTIFKKIGLEKEMKRLETKKFNSGKGKVRGRRTRQKVGPLVIVSEFRGLEKACKNMPGIDVAKVNELTVEQLAPGTEPGRLCIWTESALLALNKTAG